MPDLKQRIKGLFKKENFQKLARTAQKVGVKAQKTQEKYFGVSPVKMPEMDLFGVSPGKKKSRKQKKR